MSDPDPQALPLNAPEYTVAELSRRLKRSIEDGFGHVRVRGEISGLRRPASGHVYFALKDDQAVLDGVVWRGQAARLGFQPEDGLEVVCTGRLTTYAPRSRYQIVIEQMAPAGVGALMALLEERRVKLAREGLFDAERKQPLPYLPTVIGVVTSPTGAVIRDILHRLADRFPRRVLIWPVLVQGEGAAEQIAAAIAGFNALSPGGTPPRPDLVIVARGGGSIEDLWAFNEEVVVRAAAASRIPLISAVGHETDTTLIDHAADRRAPTPTAAAEMAVPVRAELVAQIKELDRRHYAAETRLLAERRERVIGLARALSHPRRLLETQAQRLDDVAEGLRRALALAVANRRGALGAATARLRPGLLSHRMTEAREACRRAGEELGRNWQRAAELRRDRLATLHRLLASLSYKGVLARGFAVVRDGAGAAITSVAAATPGGPIEIEFQDGRAPATFGAGATAARSGAKAKRRPGQGELF